MIKLINKSKKSQSQVVTAVLLILIVIMLAFIVMNFVVHFVKNNLSGSSCLEVAGSVKITNNVKYTCFNVTQGTDFTLVQIHIDDINATIEGFKIELGGASSKTYTIKQGGSDPAITMYDGSPTLEIPGNNEERTYNITREGLPDYIKVYPILTGGKTCEFSDSLKKVPFCT